MKWAISYDAVSKFALLIVDRSSAERKRIACTRVRATFSSLPHISTDARKLEHTSGRRGSPKIMQ
jgi:hypothetical protein